MACDGSQKSAIDAKIHTISCLARFNSNGNSRANEKLQHTIFIGYIEHILVRDTHVLGLVEGLHCIAQRAKSLTHRGNIDIRRTGD